MSDASAFSPDYLAARARFRSSALALGCRTEAHPIGAKGPDGDELTIDVAVLGDQRPRRAVVVSSGLHGVEGYLGSAVQAALLEDRLGGFQAPPGTAIVLLHALNPYGFAFTRRVNEDNVDLNRNFLTDGEPYSGSPEKYGLLDPLLNPTKAPSSLEPFRAKAAIAILQHGMGALRDAVAGGQYDFPKGLFFGGTGPSRTQRVLHELLPRLVGTAARIVHVDFHTGLGAWGSYKLLVDHERGSDGHSALATRFGDDAVQPWDTGGVSYRIRGGMGGWCKRVVGPHYDVVAAEFGTYPILSVISALRTENQAHHWGGADNPATARAKERLKEIFAPASRDWRDVVVERGLRIVDQAFETVGVLEVA